MSSKLWIDACEEMSSEMAVAAHSELSQALDINSKDNMDSGSKTAKLKAMVSQCLLDCVNHDRNLGLKMLESYRTKWLDVMVSQFVHFVLLNPSLNSESIPEILASFLLPSTDGK